MHLSRFNLDGAATPRDGLTRGLEVEAALAAEAAWELKEAVASMAVGSVVSIVHLSPVYFSCQISLLVC